MELAVALSRLPTICRCDLAEVRTKGPLPSPSSMAKFQSMILVVDKTQIVPSVSMVPLTEPAPIARFTSNMGPAKDAEDAEAINSANAATEFIFIQHPSCGIWIVRSC